MIRINSEVELIETFRILDREEVEVPKDVQYPLTIKDYFSWEESSGHKVYLVFSDPNLRSGMGIVFHRDQGAGGASSMCEWCHAVRSGNGVSLLTATANSKRRVGIYLCRDLSCRDKVDAPPSPDDIPQLLTGRAKMRKILERMTNFSKQNLF